MEFVIIVFWLILSFVVANLGSSKSIGYGGALIVSLVFSPLIGLLVVIASGEKKKQKKFNPKVIKLTDKAIKLKNTDIDEAIRIMQGALYGDPHFGRSHYNLACLYSIKNEKELAFKHLSKAAELKYKDIGLVTTDTDLGWLRSQPEFEPFILNGYTLLENNSGGENSSNKYIIELKELAKLKDQGVLTEKEFETEKKRILKNQD